ncbi:CHAT domain-containing protein [Corallococcus interemptor]|uniref:CHAT domain-containing protein n=1 Tax=Corallococcus interemptor TaxID=2316720 RepID=UPI0035D448B8
MSTSGTAAPAFWLEVDLALAGDEVSATARGSGGQQPAPHRLGHSREALLRFGEWVRDAAVRGVPLESPEQARALHSALFREGLQEVLLELRGVSRNTGSQKPLLLRLLPRDRELQALPWEALCGQSGPLDFLGISPELCIVRGVQSTKPWLPREVTGAVRLLVVSPLDEEAPDRLRAMLQPAIDSGALEWMPPLVGPRSRRDYVIDRLRSEPSPHILHFIGHGGVDARGAPVLQLTDADGASAGLPVELLAKELAGAFRGDLRLVVLEACQGAQPGTLTSAAELLAQGGADAVVAHLWPVKTDVARACSRAFYRALVGDTRHRGDVARCLHDARSTVLTEFSESAEAFSPVLYLRGSDTTLFSFRPARAKPAPRAPVQAEPVRGEDPSLRGLMDLVSRPFSLVLGDHGGTTDEDLRELLHGRMRGTPWAVPDALPMSALAQRFTLRFGPKTLDSHFQEVFRDATPTLPLVEALARRLGPGVHITLLRMPVLEQALARHRPELPLYVIQPSSPDEGSALIRRRLPGQGWEPLDALPLDFDPSRDVALVRLYRGYLPDRVFETPLLTEDDYLHGVRDLESVLPPDLADAILGTLDSRPALLVGLSLLAWHHRMLLSRLFGRRPLPRKSLVLLEPGVHEAESWRSGRGLPAGAGIQVVQADADAVAGSLGTGTPGGSR